MFRPQPTPLAGFYGMPADFAESPYRQQQHPQTNHQLIFFDAQEVGGATIAGSQQGPGLQQHQLQVGGEGIGGRGSYGGPGSGLPIGAFGGIAASGGAEATSVTGAAGGPAGPGLPLSSPSPAPSALLLTSPLFNNNNNIHTNLNGAGSTLFHSSFGNGNRHNQPSYHPDQQISCQRHTQGKHIRKRVDGRYRRRSNIRMDLDQEYSADLAAQEAAAREYQPDLQGPLVGDKIPSTAITEAYAQADPVYIQKTLVLPQTYSYYRPVRGDGNCGWRAIAFGYFESLIRSGDASRVRAERARIIQYQILDHLEMVYEDMRDEVDILMDHIAAALPDQARAMDILVHKFNDLEVAEPILYYLRLLASSWFKGDECAAEFLPFIPGGSGIREYCQDNLEVPGREIDHLGIMILYNVLLKPCGMVIEIAVLDRSDGAQVNTHRIPEELIGLDSSTHGQVIHLLFRPDHYDILYPHAPPPPSAPVDIQVNHVSGFSHQHHITPNVNNLQRFSEGGMDVLSLIPGLSLSTAMPPLAMQPSPSIDSYSPSPQPPWGMPSPFDQPLPIRQQHHQPTRLEHEHTPPVMRAVPAVTQPQPLPAGQPAAVRLSHLCHPALVENDAFKDPQFTTNTFKNSHYNKAHYNNPNFQPEEYKPEEDEANYETVRKPARARRSH